ncbi:MAG: hypothetical protein K2K68_06780 [Duncaniella sp.]|nr:hypothetical protein [Duncaniella sp.]MDE6582209.1 hypothetical protein [Duncaniella sp.]
MKKLKFLAFLMMGIVACFGLTSCGDDDDDEPGDESSVVGTWVAKYYDDSEGCGNVTETLEFKADGTCSTTHRCEDPYEGVVKAKGTYVVLGDPEDGCYIRMRLMFDDEPGVYETVEMFVKRQGNKLIAYNDEGETLTLTRK